MREAVDRIMGRFGVAELAEGDNVEGLELPD